MNRPVKPSESKLKVTSRRVIRILGVIIVIIILLGGSGFVYQFASDTKDGQRYPPPGQMVDIGGYRLHLFALVKEARQLC